MMKKTLKKSLLFLFAVTTIIIFFVFSASAAKSGYYTYETGGSTATITEVDNKISGDIVIPEKFGKYTVTAVKADAFYDCAGLTGVTIPATVETFGENELLGGYYFSPFLGCDNIEFFKVDSDNKYFCSDKNGVLYSKDKTVLFIYPPAASIKEYTVPSTVKTISSSAFDFSSGDGFLPAKQKSLKKVNIGKNVESMDHSFSMCSSLKEISVSASNKYYASVNGVLYNKNKTTLIKYPEGTTKTTFIIPKTVKEISFQAFARNLSLEKVYIHKNVRSLSDVFFDPYTDGTSLKTVCYEGTKAQWNKIDKGMFDTDYIYPAIDVIFNSEIPSATENSVGKVRNVKASQSTSTITLKWSKVTGADGYRVYKYNSKTKKYEKLKDVKGTSLKISKLKAGTVYKFKVRAYIKNKKTEWGSYSSVIETATKPGAPKLSKISTTKGKVNFTWSDVSGETGYQVYYSTKKDSGYKKLEAYKANVKKGSKSKLKSGKKYFFKVRAYKKAANGTVYSSWSNVKSIKIK